MKTLDNIKKCAVHGFVLLVLAFLTLPSNSQAAQSVQGVSGTWSNVTGGENLQGIGTNQIYWGANDQTKSEKSSYQYLAPNPMIFPVTLGQTFDLGTWTFINGVIPIGSGITGATLNITASFDINGTLIANLPFSYNLLHDETPNIPGQCPPGSVSVCDDVDTFTNNQAHSTLVTVNGQEYNIDVLGFMVNGQLATQFLTSENKNSSAVLEAIITTVNTPEPSTYLMLGSTMVIALFALRQRNKRQCV